MFGKRSTAPVCPLLGGKPCLGEGCMFWVKLRGNHPQTGQPVDQADCTYRWLPILMIENTGKVVETGAAIESFRNEVVRQQPVGVVGYMPDGLAQLPGARKA